MLYCYKRPILVLGCGNILFGDDGFGPMVIEILKKNYNLREIGISQTSACLVTSPGLW